MTFAAALVVAAGSAGAAPPAPPASRDIDCRTVDGALVHAQVYAAANAGSDGILLAPGAVFDAASWKPLAEKLAARGARVLALDYRAGTGAEPATERPRTLGLDVLAGVGCLRREGARRISLLGASLGAIAVSNAALDPRMGPLDRLLFLSPPALADPDSLPGRKLVIFSEDEPLAPRVRALSAQLAPPKELVALPGQAHAQHIFATPQADALTKRILGFLTPSATD